MRGFFARSTRILAAAVDVSNPTVLIDCPLLAYYALKRREMLAFGLVFLVAAFGTMSPGG